jgi:hypothetical protein
MNQILRRPRTYPTPRRGRTLWSCRAAILLSLVTALAIAPAALAQGCAMCYQNAAASGQHGRAALRHGILILLLPAISLFLGIFGLIYRRRGIPHR